MTDLPVPAVYHSLIFIARRYASAVYAVIMCLSVNPYVTRRYSTKAAKHKITQITPYDRRDFSFLMQCSSG